jgi:hypothetical protein
LDAPDVLSSYCNDFYSKYKVYSPKSTPAHCQTLEASFKSGMFPIGGAVSAGISSPSSVTFFSTF